MREMAHIPLHWSTPQMPSMSRDPKWLRGPFLVAFKVAQEGPYLQ